MAGPNKLILRQTDSPWSGDLNKNSVLSRSEVDGNFIYLKGNIINGITENGGVLTLNKINGNNLSVNLTGLTSDIFVTGSTFNNSTNILNLVRNDGNSITTDLSFLSNDIYTTSGVYDIDSGIVTFTNSTGGTFDVSGFTSGMTDTVVTGFTYDNNNTFTISRNQNLPDLSVLVNQMSGLTVTGDINVGGTVNGFIISGGTFVGSGSGLTGVPGTNYWISGSTGVNSIKTVGNVGDATNDRAVAIGTDTLASGNSSFAGGLRNVSSALGSFVAGGEDNVASGNNAFAEGGGVIASGLRSHSQNHITYSSGWYSHAGGRGNSNSGLNYVVASGDTSFVHFRNSLIKNMGAYADNSSILGGLNHIIRSGSTNSSILGGDSNIIDYDVLNSVVLGGNNMSGLTSNTVYIPNLNIVSGLTNDNSLTQLLVRDNDGSIKYRSTNSISFTGNTSGNCISDLYVSNIHSCSPLFINPNNEGNIYVGNDSGLTYDINNSRLGIGVNNVNSKLHIRGSGSGNTTTSLLVQNSLSTNLFEVRDDGKVDSRDGYWVNGNLAVDTDTTTDNVAIGINLPDVETSGARNTIIGTDVSTSLSGDRNSIFGWKAGASLTSGGFNMLIGSQAGDAITTGQYNIGIGYRALNSLTTGSRNLAFGDFANQNGTTESNTICFGYNSSPLASNEWVVGSSNFNVNNFYWGRGNEVTNPAAFLSMNWYATSIEDGASDDVNLSSINWTFNGARGSGTGSGGNLKFAVAPPSETTGSTRNSSVDHLTINGNGDGIEFHKRVFHEEVITNTGTGYTADLSQTNIFKLTATDDFTLDYSNAKTGTYIFIIEQDGTGGRAISFASSKFRTAGGSTPTLTATAGATDILSCIYSEDDSRMYIYDTNDFQDI